MNQPRRAFLSQVGQGVLMASVGSQLSGELGLASAAAADGPARLDFGKHEPLAALLQMTPPAKLLPVVVGRLQKGTPLKDLSPRPRLPTHGSSAVRTTLATTP